MLELVQNSHTGKQHDLIITGSHYHMFKWHYIKHDSDKVKLKSRNTRYVAFMSGDVRHKVRGDSDVRIKSMDMHGDNDVRVE